MPSSRDRSPANLARGGKRSIYYSVYLFAFYLSICLSLFCLSIFGLSFYPCYLSRVFPSTRKFQLCGPRRRAARHVRWGVDDRKYIRLASTPQHGAPNHPSDHRQPDPSLRRTCRFPKRRG